MGCPCSTHKTEIFVQANDVKELVQMMTEENYLIEEEFKSLENRQTVDIGKMNYIKKFLNNANLNVRDLKIKTVNNNSHKFTKLKELTKNFYSFYNNHSTSEMEESHKSLNEHINSLFN